MKKKCMAVGGTAKKPATMEEQLAGIRGKVRPGYQAGGIAGIDYPQSFSGQFPARQPLGSGLGATAIQSGEYAVNAPGSTPQSLGLLGAPDYSTGPNQGGFVYEDGTPRPTESTSPILSTAQAPLLSMAEKESALGLNPNRVYKPGSAMDPLASGGGISQAIKVADATGVFRKPAPDINQLAQFDVPRRRGRQRPDFADGGILDKLIRTVGKILPESNGQKYEPGIQSRASEDPARHGRAEALNPRTQTASSDTTPAGGFQEEAERRRKQMKEAMSYEAGGLITPVNLGQGLYQAIAQPIAEDWRQGNAAIKKLRDQYPTADTLAGINPFVAAAQVANDVAAGNVGGDTAINVAQAVPVIKGLSGMAKMLTKQAGPTIGATKFVIDMPNTVRKNVALTTGQTLGQPANAFAAGGMVKFSGKGGPRDDQIPVKVAGQEINVSNGENAVILPAKTAANPAALYAIGGIIQATNDGRKPKMGMEKGGRYKDGAYPYDDKPPPTAQQVYAPTYAAPGSIIGALPEGGYLRTPEGRAQVMEALSGKGLRPDVGILGPRNAAPVAPVIAQEQPQIVARNKEVMNSGAGTGRIELPITSAQKQAAIANTAAARQSQGITAGVAQPSGAVVKDGMTTTQMGAGFDPTKLQMAPGYGMATNAAGKTISVGPAEYVGADGKPTSRWTDTQQYKDAIARNEADKLRLAEMQARRLGADPMAVQKSSQWIAQSVMQAPLDARMKQQQIQQGDIAAQNARDLSALYQAHKEAKTPEDRGMYEEAIRVRTGKDKPEEFAHAAGGTTINPTTMGVEKTPDVIYSKRTGKPPGGTPQMDITGTAEANKIKADYQAKKITKEQANAALAKLEGR